MLSIFQFWFRLLCGTGARLEHLRRAWKASFRKDRCQQGWLSESGTVHRLLYKGKDYGTPGMDSMQNCFSIIAREYPLSLTSLSHCLMICVLFPGRNHNQIPSTDHRISVLNDLHTPTCSILKSLKLPQTVFKLFSTCFFGSKVTFVFSPLKLPLCKREFS